MLIYKHKKIVNVSQWYIINDNIINHYSLINITICSVDIVMP